MLKLRTVFSNKFFKTGRVCQFSNSSNDLNESVDEKMQAWQIHSYGSLDELSLSNTRIPVLTTPSDVLVKVNASSVNPIDVAMLGSYGSTVFNLLRKAKACCGESVSDIEFPLIMGRDFSGTVVSKGHGIEKLNVGDEVWGVVPIEQQGCHAQYVKVNSSLVNLKPANLSYIEAASVLYAALTAWSALWYTGGLCYKISLPLQINRKVLVLGGSGGVGTLAVQLLKAWNMEVITTCSSDAVDLLKQIGADTVIDYTDEAADSYISSQGPYHIILDCCNQGAQTIKSKGYSHFNYITLNSPLLRNIDEHGLILGTIRNLGDLVQQNIPTNQNQGLVKWGFFTPSATGINIIQEFVESGKIIPVIQEVFKFEDLPKAYERVSQGHLRGKIVIDMR